MNVFERAQQAVAKIPVGLSSDGDTVYAGHFVSSEIVAAVLNAVAVSLSDSADEETTKGCLKSVLNGCH